MRRAASMVTIGLLVSATIVTTLSPPARAASASSYPEEFVEFGDLVVFTAWDGLHGKELWATDLVDTWLLADAFPGPQSSFPVAMTVSGDHVFFFAEDPDHGQELWLTDGTPAGTRLAADTWPGPDSGTNNSLAAVGNDGDVVFTADDGVTGEELHRYDVSADAVVLVDDIEVGAGDSFPSAFATIDGDVWFSARTGATGFEPYVTDGTTVMTLGDLSPGAADSSPGQFVDAGADVLFAATGPQGREPWASDGTLGGTQILLDVNPGAGSSFPAGTVPFDGRWVFAADDGVAGREVWATDGTGAGTQLLHDVNAGGDSSQPFSLTSVGDHLYFSARSAAVGQELWRTDGSPGGLELVEDLASGAGGSFPGIMGLAGTHLVFHAETPDEGREVWVTDVSGTDVSMLVESIAGPIGHHPDGMASLGLGDEVVFRKVDGHGYEPWITDGTTAGTRRLADVQPGIGPGGLPLDNGDVVVTADDRAFFSGHHPLYGHELWVADATPGSARVLDLVPGPSPSMARPLLAFGDGVLLQALDVGGAGLQLWFSDGTEAGTVQLTALGDGEDGANPRQLTLVNGRVMFTAITPEHGRELWRTDGTPEGTVLVADIRPGPNGSSPSDLVTHGPQLFFRADNGSDGGEPFVSDGTAAGTLQITDLNPGASGSDPSGFVSWDGWVWFGATDGVSGPELWRTQGSFPTTELVHEVVAGAGGGDPEHLTVAGGQLFFTAHTGAAGRELYVSDGTGAGTGLVEDIAAGAPGSDPAGLVAFADGLAFTAWTNGTGRELWTSDGTAAGTDIVTDLVPGASSSDPGELTAVDGVLAFTALQPDGRRLMTSDGTPGGTTTSGLPGVNPTQLRPGSLWYTAYDPVTGRGELYRASGATATDAVQITDVPALDRLAGPDRYATAAAVASDTFAAADTVVIARGDEYADALAGAPLARELDAPILLVRPTSLPDVTAAEISRLGATSVVVLGGAGAIADAVVEAIEDTTSVTTVERVFGLNRFETAVAIAGELSDPADPYVVEGINPDPNRGWPDAVAVSALSAHRAAPILLTTRDVLPDATAAHLSSTAPATATIVGGQAAVSVGVASAVQDLGIAVERLAGDTRYETSLVVAAAAVDAGLYAPRTWLATGRAFPDALVAGPAAASRQAVLLLVDGTGMTATSPSAAWFDDVLFERVVLLGGQAAVSEGVAGVVADLLGL